MQISSHPTPLILLPSPSFYGLNNPTPPQDPFLFPFKMKTEHLRMCGLHWSVAFYHFIIHFLVSLLRFFLPHYLSINIKHPVFLIYFFNYFFISILLSLFFLFFGYPWFSLCLSLHDSFHTEYPRRWSHFGMFKGCVINRCSISSILFVLGARGAGGGGAAICS